jgi:DNA invertase Pin-like site-specific DNA recombinase
MRTYCLTQEGQMRVALYSRVSTKDKQDPENQRLQLQDYCQRQRWDIIDEYGDKISGKASDNRDDFQRLMTDASRKRFDVVVVWALDRFTREGVAETFAHVAKLKGYGIEFDSYTEPHFRTTGPAGELMLAVAAWIAKQERVRLHERITAGVERAKAQGKVFGRAGWKSRQGSITDEQRRKILELAGTRSMRDIARLVPGVSKSTVHNVLSTKPIQNVGLFLVGEGVGI